MTRSEALDEGLHIVDLGFQGLPGVIGSFVLTDGSEFGIVETGPTTCLPKLLDSIEAFGGLDRLSSIVVTHIHLDHSGAVGEILARAPQVTCYVHSRGVEHLVDPARLLRSAGRIYGRQMESLWGPVTPAPAGQVVAVEDGDVILLGGTELHVLYTPGHAVHHIALHDRGRSAVFTGDIAGVRLQGSTHVRPPTPPPDVDTDGWRQSVDRIREVEPRTLLLTHYGAFAADVERHLAAVIDRLEAWTELVRVAREDGQHPPTIVDSLRREGDPEILSEGGDPDMLRRYDLASPYGMSVDGLLRYLETQE